ncbi:MAG: hypothetical protein RLZZ619_1333 [Pseudomonadota bacterium]|jgi:uncharacterized membrane protein YeaQ/YmgE (transglycosylase-associated protein family)
MSFLAFLVFGGFVGFLASYLHPKKSSKKASLFSRIMVPVTLGAMSSAITSVLGQTLGLFKSGQVLEWLSAMLFAIFCVFLFKIGKK